MLSTWMRRERFLSPGIGIFVKTARRLRVEVVGFILPDTGGSPVSVWASTAAC